MSACTSLSLFLGNAGDSLAYHDSYQFSTFDMDRDIDSRNCAKVFHGGWWYRDCLESNLNGLYRNEETYDGPNSTGVFWAAFKGDQYSLKSAEMKIRPKT